MEEHAGVYRGGLSGGLYHHHQLIGSLLQTAYKNLVILEINPHDIIAMGIVNQRGTSVLWNKQTGQPLHNALCWVFP